MTVAQIARQILRDNFNTKEEARSFSELHHVCEVATKEQVAEVHKMAMTVRATKEEKERFEYYLVTKVRLAPQGRQFVVWDRIDREFSRLVELMKEE